MKYKGKALRELAKEKRMRLIDADEFESYLITRYGGNDCADDIIEDLHNQPTVDAVEVVRCKDCKYLSHDRIAPEFNRVCRQSGAGKPDYGFCDDGDRRSE